MKVTAIIDDHLIDDIKEYTQSDTTTEAITIVLKDWIDTYNIKQLNKKISQDPIHISNGQQIRDANRLS
jgi:hypothetical protein